MNKEAHGYEDALTRWMLARKQTSSEIDIGPEPDPKLYGFENEQEQWEAAQIRKRVQREMGRSA